MSMRIDFLDMGSSRRLEVIGCTERGGGSRVRRERKADRKNERKKQLHRVHRGRSTEATERPIRDDSGGCGRRLARASEMWPPARSASASFCRGGLGHGSFGPGR